MAARRGRVPPGSRRQRVHDEHQAPPRRDGPRQAEPDPRSRGSLDRHGGLDGAGLDRTREEEALAELAAERAQPFGLGGFLDALGDDPQPQCLPEGDDRVGERPFVGIPVGRTTNSRAIFRMSTGNRRRYPSDE